LNVPRRKARAGRELNAIRVPQYSHLVFRRKPFAFQVCSFLRPRLTLHPAWKSWVTSVPTDPRLQA